MALSRRGLMLGTGPALLASRVPAWAADAYPTKPIRFIIGNVPGGSTDFSARVLAEALTTRLGQTVIVENKPGASTSIALDYVAKAPPDGYILAYASSDGTAMLTAEKPNMPYDIKKDFAYISRAVQSDFVLVLNPKLPVHSMSELVAYAKANPGKLRYGSIGVGSSTHLATLLLCQKAGITMTHVPYRGGNAVLTDLLAGVIDLGFLTVVNINDYRGTDKLRLLAVTSKERESALPDVPTFAEGGYADASVSVWLGLLGPAKLPAEIVQHLRAACADALADPTVRDRLLRLALTPAPLTGDAFRDLVLAESEQWRTVVQSAHLVVNE